MNRIIFLTLGLIVFAINLKGQNTSSSDTLTFEKVRWETSSDYRYEIVKGNKFPSVTNISKKEIIKILGKPDFEQEKKITYCFDIRNHKEKDKNCNGSYLTISLNKNIPEKYRLTIAWVETNN